MIWIVLRFKGELLANKKEIIFMQSDSIDGEICLLELPPHRPFVTLFYYLSNWN